MTPVPYAMYSQDLGLPFQKGINSPSRVFEVRNDGGTGAAITAESSGSGRALEVFADGTADAAFFGIR